MSYTVHTRVYQTKPTAYFHIVEKGVWHYANGGTWTETTGAQQLAMGGSGTSGILRFAADTGDERFFVAMGVHNNKPWVDIVTGLSPDATGVKELPEYYQSNTERAKAREGQRTSWKATSTTGRVIEAKYRVAEGKTLELDIIVC